MQVLVDLRDHARGIIFASALFAALTTLRDDDQSGAGAGLAACGAGGATMAGAKLAKGCGSGAKLAGGAAKAGAAAKLGAKAGAVGLAGSEAAGVTHIVPTGLLDDAARVGGGAADDAGRALGNATDDLARTGVVGAAEDGGRAGRLGEAGAAGEEESAAAKVAEDLGPDALQLAVEEDTGE